MPKYEQKLSNLSNKSLPNVRAYVKNILRHFSFIIEKGKLQNLSLN